MSVDLDVAVVGAGISGLALAYALQRAGRSVHVFEAGARPGGRMRTLRRDGYVMDEGAEMISTRGYERTWRLVRELGLPTADVLAVASPIALWRRGRAHPHVGRPLGLLTGAGLSARARLDLLRFNASVGLRSRAFDHDRPETMPLAQVSLRRLAGRYCRELTDCLIEPLAGGFFGWELDRTAAGPLAALLLASGSTTYWRTYRHGMDTLARALARRLDVSTRFAVREVVSGSESARIVGSKESVTARSVVLCVPAPVAAQLHVNAPHDERPYLQACTYAPMLKVSCMLARPLTVRGASSAYVVILPATENEILSGLTVDHNKGPGRVPSGGGLVCLLTRPEATRELIDAPDEEIVRVLTEQGESYLPGLRGELRGHVVHRFHHGLPEATPAALGLRSDFQRRPVRSVDYAGDWMMLRPNSEGAIRSAELTVARVVAHGCVDAPRALAAKEP